MRRYAKRIGRPMKYILLLTTLTSCLNPSPRDVLDDAINNPSISQCYYIERDYPITKGEICVTFTPAE